MNREELKKYYADNGPIIGTDWRKPENKKFLNSLKSEFAFLDGIAAKVPPALYLEALHRDLESPPPCETCGATVKSLVNGKFATYCSKKCAGDRLKGVSKLPARALNVLDDPNTLKRYLRNFNPDELAEELSVSKRSVYNYMQKYEIPRNGNVGRLDREVRTFFSSNNLKSEYDEIGVDGIADRYKVSRTAVYRALKDKEIELHRGIQHDAKSILSSPEHLSELYNSIGCAGIATNYGVDKTTVYNYMYSHGIPRDSNDSYLETSFETFITELGVRYTRNDRKLLNGVELDFVFPDQKIAVEMNGLYWHSSLFRDRGYHLKKTELAAEKGYQLVHIYEDEWNSRNKQWKRKIESLLGVNRRRSIGARKTAFSVVDTNSISTFMEENHIQGFVGGCLSVSLKFEGITVAVAIFRKDPSNPKNALLNRYATSCHVVGGLSKIMKNSIPILREMGFGTITSFADRGISNGNLYDTTGWNRVETVPPDYRYVYKCKRVRKQNFRRSKLPAILGEKFNPKLSERENMELAGIPRIYDCGLIKYKLDISGFPSSK